MVRFYYSRPEADQILVTFGVGIILVEAIPRDVRRPVAEHADPGVGPGRVRIWRADVPVSLVQDSDGGDLGRAADGVLSGALPDQVGLVVRAGIEDAGMVSMLGINVYRVFLIVFGLARRRRGWRGYQRADHRRRRRTWARATWC